jgi:cytochrome c oxidase subunit 3
MSVVVFFIFVIVGCAYYYLWRQRVTEQPWVTQGTEVDTRVDIGQVSPTAKTGLILFLAVVTSLFSLFISAYFLRMELSDWRPVEEPQLLWANTLLLVLGSVSIHLSGRAAASSNARMVKLGLLATGLFTGAFILGQLIAWQQLIDAGYYLQSNPANAFFYLFTGLHGLHLLGGLWVWSYTTLRVLAGIEPEEIRLSIELCRTYWHYLLVVWVVLFGLLLST